MFYIKFAKTFCKGPEYVFNMWFSIEESLIIVWIVIYMQVHLEIMEHLVILQLKIHDLDY